MLVGKSLGCRKGQPGMRSFTRLFPSVLSRAIAASTTNFWRPDKQARAGDAAHVTGQTQCRWSPLLTPRTLHR